jgi:hypothetical protein
MFFAVRMNQRFHGEDLNCTNELPKLSNKKLVTTHNIIRRPDRTWIGPEPGDYYRCAADEQNHWPPSHVVDYNSPDVEESTAVFKTGVKEEKLDEEEEEVEYLGEFVHPPAADYQFEEDYYDENGDEEISIKEEEDQFGTSDSAAAAAEDLIGSDTLWQQFDEMPAGPFVVETEEGDQNVASVKPTPVASNGNEAAAAVVPPAVVPPAVVPAGGVPSCLLARPATRQLVNYWQLKHQQWRSSEEELKIPLAARDQEGGLVAVRAG